MAGELEAGIGILFFLPRFPYLAPTAVSLLTALSFAQLFILLMFGSRLRSRKLKASLWAMTGAMFLAVFTAGVWQDAESASATLEEFEGVFLDQYFITIISASFMLVVSTAITRNFIPRRIGWVAGLATLLGFFYFRASGTDPDDSSKLSFLIIEQTAVFLALVGPVLFLVASERSRKQHAWVVWWSIITLYAGIFYLSFTRLGGFEAVISENLPYVLAIFLFAFAILFASSATWTWVEWSCVLGLLFLALYSGIDRHEWGEVLFNGQLL